MTIRALLLPLNLLLAMTLWRGVRCEEPAPKAEVPPPAAEAKGDEKDKKGDEAKGEKGPVDPTQVTGTPPTFPLVTENMANISDSYDDQQDQMVMEQRPRADIFNALFASSQEYLVKNANAKVSYRDLMLHPEDHRGEVVTVSGVLRQISKVDCDEAKYRVKNYWMGYISFGAKEIKTFIVLEPPAPDIKVGSALNITGIFMKRFAYLNQEPGEKLTVTPLVIARRAERSTAFDHPATEGTMAWMNGPVGIGVFFVVGCSLAVFFYTRINSRARYSNKFTRMKEDRKGPQGNFPRPG
jgi:hypothetical protein